VNVEFAFLCDSAQESGGKVHALGIGFDSILAQSVPATHPMLTVVAQLRYSVAEAGAKALAIRAVDADGQNIVSPIDRQIEFPEPPRRPTNTARLIIALTGVRFTSYGDYSVHVAINGSEVARLPLTVVAPQPAAS
jgi:hypothetical protein